jgi:hypothetical protein
MKIQRAALKDTLRSSNVAMENPINGCFDGKIINKWKIIYK